MSISFSSDVIIVGAGPAGLALACALADAGIPQPGAGATTGCGALAQPPERPTVILR